MTSKRSFAKQSVVVEPTMEEIMLRLTDQDKVQSKTDEKVQLILDILMGSSVHRTRGVRSAVETLEVDFRVLKQDAQEIKTEMEAMKSTVQASDERLRKIDESKRFTWGDIRTKLFAVFVGLNTLLAIGVMIKELFFK